MSYILDALRRADSERERGAVPNLHAKPVPEAFVDEEGESRRSQPLLWAVIALSVVLAGVLAWQFMGTSSPEPVAAAPQPMPAPVAQPVAPTVAPPPVLQALPPVAPAPAPVVAPAPAQARKPARAVAKAPAPASAAEEAPVRALSELPDDIRRELPQLTVGGAMYSQTAANRMLILNGQVFHEGDKVQPNLVLEQIRLKSAVLAYKGHRYGINY